MDHGEFFNGDSAQIPGCAGKWPHIALSAGILVSGPAAKNKCSALLHILIKQSGSLIAHYRRMRVDQHLIRNEVLKRGLAADVEDIIRDMPLLQRLEPFLVALPHERSMPDIVFTVPFIVIITQNGNARLIAGAGNMLACFSQLPSDLCGLPYSAVRLVVIIIQAVPVNLMAHRCRPPAEVEQLVRSMGNGLIGPEPHLARFG
ncbi:hypothetical protein D3C75_859980 [compost metagenome]